MSTHQQPDISTLREVAAFLCCGALCLALTGGVVAVAVYGWRPQ